MAEKYTREELTAMAKRVVQARDEGDVRYLQFVMSLAMKTGRDPNYIKHEIERMAKGAQ